MLAKRATSRILAFSLLLLPAIAASDQTKVPPANSEKSGRQEVSIPPEGPYGPGTVGPNRGSAFGNEPAPPAAATSAAPLAYSASRSDLALRVEDLMRGAAALRIRGDYAKAMPLYNEALAMAPRYADAYRQRAMTLARLGDRMQAQVDYDRFLELDPQATNRVREEITLFEQSGRARIGEAEAASYSYGLPVAPGPVRVAAAPWGVAPALVVGSRAGAPVVYPSTQQLAEARFAWAQDAFERQDYDSALLWARNSNRDVPQARTSALIAQTLFAQGDFRGAAVEARAAVALGPVMDWRMLYGYYGRTMPRFSQQIHNLEEFVRRNPSSPDGHFLLGYEQLILGHANVAHAQLAIAAVLEPTDVVATNLLAKDGLEIVGSRRPLAQAGSAKVGEDVARRSATFAQQPQPPQKPIDRR